MSGRCTCGTGSGCAYHAEWMRKKRATDPEFRERQLKASAKWRAKNRERHRETSRKWYHANKERYEARKSDGRIRKARLKHKYGMSEAEYEGLLIAQSGSCAICHEATGSRNSSDLCVDHNHETGKIRGLLCDECNLLLGYAKDSPDRLREAIAYLEEAM